MSQILELQGRLSFEHIFKASAGQNGGDPKFSASLLFEKGGTMENKVNAAIERVAAERWGAKAAQILAGLRAQDRVCLHNGDLKTYDGYAGMSYIAASSPNRPAVVNRRGQPVAESDTVGRPYSGCYVNLFVEIWAMDNQYGKRICATLRGVQFVKDGDSFAGGAAPMKAGDFSDLGDEDDDLM